MPTTAADQADIKADRIIGTILTFPKLGYVSAPYSKKAKAGSKDPAAPPKRLLEAASTTPSGEITSIPRATASTRSAVSFSN